MHRSYQSILPCQSKILQQKWDSKYYDTHRSMVREAKPMVDTKPPRTYMHLHLKLKKLQVEEERLATIERDNRILLEKMSYIMRTQGRIDNKNEYEYKSLNREKRMRELLRITRENQEILKRICAREPEYDHRKWQRDWEENQIFMDSISAFPKDWWKDGKEEEKEASNKESSAKSKNGKKEKKKDSAKSKNSSRDKSKRKSTDDDDSEDKQDSGEEEKQD